MKRKILAFALLMSAIVTLGSGCYVQGGGYGGHHHHSHHYRGY